MCSQTNVSEISVYKYGSISKLEIVRNKLERGGWTDRERENTKRSPKLFPESLESRILNTYFASRGLTKERADNADTITRFIPPMHWKQNNP